VVGGPAAGADTSGPGMRPGCRTKLRLGQVIRVNGAGELAGEAVPTGPVGARGLRRPDGQADADPARLPQHAATARTNRVIRYETGVVSRRAANSPYFGAPAG